MGVEITIHYDKDRVTLKDATILSSNAQTIIRDVMKKRDVFVHANESTIFISDDPIELLIYVNRDKVTDPSQLADGIAQTFGAWRQESAFPHIINLNVMPVEWHARLGV